MSKLTGGFDVGASLSWGTDGNGKVLTYGASVGSGLNLGLSYGRGQTVAGWDLTKYQAEGHLFYKNESKRKTLDWCAANCWHCTRGNCFV